MALDLKSYTDSINAGAPIPPIEPGDLRSALQFFSDVGSILDRGTTSGATPGPLRGIAFLYDDLAARCSAGADDDFIIQLLATMPLMGGELKDPNAILGRLDEMTCK